ncbi:MAG: flagellar biosynthesis protein FliQ [Oscillospiraceae bacterium]|nr:flagellar biosynthesis protein FliQ [Oscillospiraceae bacterium]
MTQEMVMEVFVEAIVLAFKLCLPLLLTAMLVGLIIAIFQAATQVHEQTLTFAPKAVAVALAMLALGPWMINNVIDFMSAMFERMATIGF